MKIPSPENIDTLRCRASADVAEIEHFGESCGCGAGNDRDVTCLAHAVLALTEPMVEAFELPWVSAR